MKVQGKNIHIEERYLEASGKTARVLNGKEEEVYRWEFVRWCESNTRKDFIFEDPKPKRKKTGDDISQFKEISSHNAEILKSEGIDIFRMDALSGNFIFVPLNEAIENSKFGKYALSKSDIEKYKLFRYTEKGKYDVFKTNSQSGDDEFGIPKSCYPELSKLFDDKTTPLHNTKDIAEISNAIALMYKYATVKENVDLYLQTITKMIGTLKVEI